jgi:hypothetical protein
MLANSANDTIKMAKATTTEVMEAFKKVNVVNQRDTR